jgi:anti-sigma B factor antagonist
MTPIYHHLGVWKRGDVLIVRFGDHQILDEATVQKISDELYAVADREDCHHLLLNFASVTHVTSLMLGKLLMLRRKMAAKGGKLKLYDVEPEVRDVFAATGLHSLLDIRESEAEALQALA